MELKDTVGLMESPDYKEQFVAEYYQLKIRHDKLAAMLDKFYKNQLDFTPKCPINILREQLSRMHDYLLILKVRADIEGVELAGVDL